VALLVALLALVVAGAWERRASPALLLSALLAATGLALGIFVEFFTLEGDIGRMNTVFKFYLQVWVMWAPVAAASLCWTMRGILARLAVPVLRAPAATVPARRPLLEDIPAATGYGDGEGLYLHDPAGTGGPADAAGPAGVAPAGASGLAWWHWIWLGGVGFLLLAVLAFPLGGIPARLADRFNPLPLTLDGMAYMPYAAIPDGSSEVTALHGQGVTLRGEADYAAIRWILSNVKGSPVVLEASIPEYRWGARIAEYTGLPAVLGWRWHQVQQRGTYGPMVDQRLRDVQLMFNDPSPARVVPLLRKYQVRYVYVGDLERAYYPAAGLAKFDQMTDVLRPVYQQDGVTIYEVIAPDAPAPGAAATSAVSATSAGAPPAAR
jgi:uncharacterized membrane protein